ncbi:gp436 family protein [Xanthobacter flavus]|uniref:gp436 family protein n=1 Tax=Xanthobacter flavus TaxID=281 RepID=UPI0037263242
MSYATLADIQEAYPAQLILLGADEATGELDEDRVNRAIVAAGADINGILFRRYTPAELANLTPDSQAILRTYAIDIALYRVALAFSRSSERVKDARDDAIKSLQAIASGAGGLTFEAPSSGGAGAVPGAEASGSPNEAVVVAPERLFTRDRLRGW